MLIDAKQISSKNLKQILQIFYSYQPYHGEAIFAPQKTVHLSASRQRHFGTLKLSIVKSLVRIYDAGNQESAKINNFYESLHIERLT